MLSDLDETLLVNHHVPKENAEAIKKAQAKGLKFVPATGRAYNMIQEILQEIGTYQKEDQYSICFNGALIMENKDDKVLHFQGISFEQAKELFDLAKNYDVCVMIFTTNMCYLFNADPTEVERKTAQKAPFKIIDEFNMDFLKHEQIAKLLYVRPSYSSYRYLEFNAIGVSKGFALRWLSEYLGIDISETIAIGDNYNDVDMIKEAALGICVPCAEGDIKELSLYVTENDYDQGAVKEAIEKFVL